MELCFFPAVNDIANSDLQPAGNRLGDSGLLLQGDKNTIRCLLYKFSVIFAGISIHKSLDTYFHAGLNIGNSHEAANTEFAHKSLDNIFNLVDIACTFIIFAEHLLADLTGTADIVCYCFHNGGYLFHIVYQLEI